MDDCGDVHRDGRACAHRGAGRVHKNGRIQGREQPKDRHRRVDGVCRGLFGLCEQYAGRGRDDSDFCPDFQAFGGLGIPAFDPAQLCGDHGGHADPDRHIHQSFGGWCRPHPRDRTLYDIRGHATGRRDCDLGDVIPVHGWALAFAGSIQHGDIAVRPQPDEILYRSGRSPGIQPCRARSDWCAIVQTRRRAADRRCARRSVVAPRPQGGDASGRGPRGSAHRDDRTPQPAAHQKPETGGPDFRRRNHHG